MAFRTTPIVTLVFSLLAASCSDDGSSGETNGAGGAGTSETTGDGDDADPAADADEPTCSDLTLDESRPYDVADRPHLMAFDIPNDFTEVITIEEERAIDVALQLPIQDGVFPPFVQYQLTQGDEPVDPAERREGLLAQEGAEVWGTIDWNGEDVDVIVIDVFDIQQAHLSVPAQTNSGKEYFGLLFQYQVIDEECDPEIRQLFDAILQTWGPNEETTFAG